MSVSERRAHCIFMFVGWLSATVLCVHAVFTLYLLFMPTSHWFYYYDIRPVKDEFVIGQPLIFESDFEVNRASNMLYHDRIMCDIGTGEYVKVFNRKAENPQHPVTLRTTQQFSLYFIPEKEMECYLHSIIVADQQFGIKKVQEVDLGYKFKLVRENDATTSTEVSTVSRQEESKTTQN